MTAKLEERKKFGEKTKEIRSSLVTLHFVPHPFMCLHHQDPREESLRQNLEQLQASKRNSLLRASLAKWQNGIDGKDWARDTSHKKKKFKTIFSHELWDPIIAGGLAQGHRS